MTYLCIEAQVNTQEYGRRPYGVGLLVIGQDKQGPHLYEFSPSGNSFEYYAISIGARSQSAKTYLEKHYESFMDCMSFLSNFSTHEILNSNTSDRQSGGSHPPRPACVAGDSPAGQRTDHQQHLDRYRRASRSTREEHSSGGSLPHSRGRGN